jgi:hypothetical protein
MDRTGHAQITTTQKYLHALPGADQKKLDALRRTRGTNPRGASADAGGETGQAD